MGLFDWFLPYTITKDRAYGSHPRHKLDTYIPKSGVTASTRVIVFFHGGGFQQGDKNQYGPIADAFVRAGHIVVVPNYRLWSRTLPLANRFPTQVQDGRDVVGWCRANLKANGAARRVFLIGHSAGAGIACHLHFDEAWLSTPVAGTVSLAGPYNFDTINRPDDLPWEFFPEGYEESKNATAHVTGSEPPCLILVGMNDEYDPNGALTITMRDAIVQAGGVVETKLYPNTDHVQILYALDRSVNNPPVRADVLAWLTAH